MFKLALKLADEPESRLWDFDGMVVLPTEDFREFYPHFGVTEECVIDNCQKTYDTLRNAGWAHEPRQHAIVDYSAKNFEAVVAAEAAGNAAFEDVAHAFQKSIAPLNVDPALEFAFETVILFHPYRLRLGTAEHSSDGMKAQFVLKVLRHEFAHAFGLSFGFRDMAVTEIEKITDAVALISGWQEDLPPEYFSLFTYLGSYFRSQQVTDNSAAIAAAKHFVQACQQ